MIWLNTLVTSKTELVKLLSIFPNQTTRGLGNLAYDFKLLLSNILLKCPAGTISKKPIPLF